MQYYNNSSNYYKYCYYLSVEPIKNNATKCCTRLKAKIYKNKLNISKLEMK